MKRERPLSPVTEALYIDAEEHADVFNLKLLAVLLACELACVLLNETGIFIAERAFLRACMLTGAVLCLTPILIWLIHDRIRKRQPSVCRKRWLKYLIILVTWLVITLFCVALSMHAVPLLVVPALITAQYRDRRRQNVLMLILTVLICLISVYGAYFFGMHDRNLHKGLATAEEATFAARVALATPENLLRLFTHHALPRLISVTAAAVLAAGISHRNGVMLAQQAALSENIQREMARRNAMQSHVIDDLAALIESRDVSTGEHVTRTKRYVELIAGEMRKSGLHTEELNDAALDRIVRAAPLHDIGKIAVSDRILQKPGRLTPEEFEEMKQHAPRGGKVIRNIFKNLEDPDFLKMAEEIATSHHEKWNGKGYPAGLKGTEIPLSARIMAAADVYDALVSPRVYKEPISPEEALAIIEGDSGSHFDPDVVRAMGAIREELIAEAKRPIPREEEPSA